MEQPGRLASVALLRQKKQPGSQQKPVSQAVNDEPEAESLQLAQQASLEATTKANLKSWAVDKELFMVALRQVRLEHPSKPAAGA